LKPTPFKKAYPEGETSQVRPLQSHVWKPNILDENVNLRQRDCFAAKSDEFITIAVVAIVNLPFRVDGK